MARLAKAGTRKRAPSSSTNATTASGWRAAGRPRSAAAAASSALTHAQRAVVGAAVRLGVEVRSRAYPGTASASAVTAHSVPRRPAAHPARGLGDLREPGPGLGLQRASRRPGSSPRRCARSRPARRTSDEVVLARSRHGRGRIRRMADARTACPDSSTPTATPFSARLRGRRRAGRSGTPARRLLEWREAMYAAAGALDPDSIHAVAWPPTGRWWPPGTSAVGEFHYPHHRPDGDAL